MSLVFIATQHIKNKLNARYVVYYTNWLYVFNIAFITIIIQSIIMIHSSMD